MQTLAAVIILIANLTYYNPELCTQGDTLAHRINCLNPATWWQMGAGTDARHWYGRALACPAEFAIGSTWRLPGVRGDKYYPAADWMCLDRGGRINTTILSDGTIRVALDLLSAHRIVGGAARVQYLGPLPYALLARVQVLRESCFGKARC